jgi:molybdenum cofactor cytidylyltransferase
MTENNAPTIGGLLLAAGGSRRLGRPKQLVLFEGKTLLRRSAEVLSGSRCDTVVVVLGAELESSMAEIIDLPVCVCINDKWQEGMSTSIKTGLAELLKIEPNLAAVLISLCDQPNICTDMIDRFILKFRVSDQQKIIASQYSGLLGVPALFSSQLFPQLLELRGDKGARELIRKVNDVFSIELEAATFDIDVNDDLPMPRI